MLDSVFDKILQFLHAIFASVNVCLTIKVNLLKKTIFWIFYFGNLICSQFKYAVNLSHSFHIWKNYDEHLFHK